MADTKSNSSLHVAMYPWFGMGHLTTFLHISNKLAERGHKISFIIPTKTMPKLTSFNLHPSLITFIPINVPPVSGLPEGAETTADVPFSLQSLIMTAMDLTKPIVEYFLQTLKPHFVFYDFTHWLPQLIRSLNLNIRCIQYCIISPATVGYLVSPERKLLEKELTEHDLMNPPINFPSSSIKLQTHEARTLAHITVKEYGSGIRFVERLLASLSESDAIAFKSCKEMEGLYVDYIQSQFNRPVLLAGPVVPEPPTEALERKWTDWLDHFKPKSIIFCAFGSECIMQKDQFQELVLGIEKTGLPFFAALKPPMGCTSIESALPEGFKNRTKEKGVVHGGWVQQQLILNHPSIGCFITHCGFGSLSEAMVNECQLVLLPNAGDQVIHARLMGGDLKVGVEVKKGEEDGLFSRDDVYEAVMKVMDEDSVLGKEVRENRRKWRELVLKEGFEKCYIDSFIQGLNGLLG